MNRSVIQFEIICKGVVNYWDQFGQQLYYEPEKGGIDPLMNDSQWLDAFVVTVAKNQRLFSSFIDLPLVGISHLIKCGKLAILATYGCCKTNRL